MASLQRLLTDDEELVLVLRRHALVLTGPVILLLLVIAALAAVFVLVPDGTGKAVALIAAAVVGLVLLARWVVWPFLVWRSTYHAITTRRLILRWGVLSRNGHDMPLTRITDVAMNQTLFHRLLGAGTLVVETAGDRGPLTLDDVPHVDHARLTLYELADGAHGLEGGGRASSGGGA